MLAGLPPLVSTTWRTDLRASCLQLLFAFGLGDDFVFLTAEQHQQVVAHDRVVGLEDLDGLRLAREDLHGDLQEAHDLVAAEIGDEGGIQRHVEGRLGGLFLSLDLLVRIVVTHEHERCRTATGQHHEGGEADDEELLALLGGGAFGRVAKWVLLPCLRSLFNRGIQRPPAEVCNVRATGLAEVRKCL